MSKRIWKKFTPIKFIVENEERKIVTPVDHNDQWRRESHLESFKERGNGWWWFQGVQQIKKVTWIEKYRKGE